MNPGQYLLQLIIDRQKRTLNGSWLCRAVIFGLYERKFVSSLQHMMGNDQPAKAWFIAERYGPRILQLSETDYCGLLVLLRARAHCLCVNHANNPYRDHMHRCASSHSHGHSFIEGYSHSLAITGVVGLRSGFSNHHRQSEILELPTLN
jgi:hypothetical protein